ncbi:MAG TPA: hypothetical protein VGP24_15375 [Glaciihabitans sp.]|jgi:hypothetical protein|nr:hypothetical protein [Glaciihabitans sp.]
MTDNRADDGSTQPPPTGEWFPFFLVIGLGAGMLIGASTDALPLGIAMGLAIGGCLDAMLYPRPTDRRDTSDDTGRDRT